MATRTSGLRAITSRCARWPVFLALGAVHLTALPLVLSESSDDVVAMTAGAAYLALAALDARHQRR